MKQIVRNAHIKEPREAVCKILGKKYPRDVEDFANSKLGGEFDPGRASKRMKIETPVTWETELSAKGNKAETWEQLVERKQLPFMAMVRNLRNMIVTGVDPKVHQLN